MKKTLLVLSLTILLTSCAVGPDYTAPDTKVPNKWHALIQASRKAKLTDWWKNFNDETLNKLINISFYQNLDNKAAVARLNQARASYGVTEANLFPTLNYSAAANRAGSSQNAASGIRSVSNLYTTGFDASWEIDIFGGKYRARQAAKADVDMHIEALRNTQVSMLAEVATNYIQLKTYQKHLDIARRNVEIQYKIHQILTDKQKTGISSAFDVLQSQIELENARVLIPQIKTQVTQAKNRITTLLGKQTGDLDELLNKRADIPQTSIKTVIGIPADMLRSRPDVNKAERKLAYATAQIGVAKAALYPSLSLGGSIGLESLKYSTLFDHASNAFALSSTIVWNIFDAGRLSKAVVLQKMVKEEAFINYQAAILKALEETENSITAYTNEKLRTHSFTTSADAAKKSYQIMVDTHKTGLIGLTELLRAEQSKLQAYNALLTSRGQSAVSLVSLYKALGGGWENFGKK